MKDKIAIHTEHLTKKFRLADGRDLYATNDVSIDVEKEKLTILKGRSGSGKTTLLNCLSTLDEATEGKIEFLGQSLTQMSLKDKENLRRYKMGFVFQSVALIPAMTAYENVDFALRLSGQMENRDERIKSVLDRVGLKKRMNHMAGQMSGGEQQRVAIARAVVHRPEIIFADEPTGAIDTAAGFEVMRLFRELTEEEHITILMTTHDPNLMELADKVFEIQDGVILDEQ